MFSLRWPSAWAWTWTWLFGAFIPHHQPTDNRRIKKCCRVWRVWCVKVLVVLLVYCFVLFSSQIPQMAATINRVTWFPSLGPPQPHPSLPKSKNRPTVVVVLSRRPLLSAAADSETNFILLSLLWPFCLFFLSRFFFHFDSLLAADGHDTRRVRKETKKIVSSFSVRFGHRLVSVVCWPSVTPSTQFDPFVIL